MKKQTRKFKVKFNFDWEYGVEISQLRNDLDELEKLGASNINIEAGSSYGDPYLEIDAYCSRIETNEEFEQRIGEAKRRIDFNKNRELCELERLKLKYEK